jgi:hypothetical protein
VSLSARKARREFHYWQQSQLETHEYVQSPVVRNTSMFNHKNFVIGNQAYRNHRRAVFLFKLSKPTSIYYTRYHIPHVEGLTNVSTNNTMQFRSWIQWIFGLLWRLECSTQPRVRDLRTEVAHIRFPASCFP